MASASSMGDAGSPSRDGPGSPGQDPPMVASQVHAAALLAVMSPQGRKGGDLCLPEVRKSEARDGSGVSAMRLGIRHPLSATE